MPFLLVLSDARLNLFLRRQATNNTIVLDIIDTGPGIPETKLETVFDRFYSERPSDERFGEHSGLGLSIARQIISAHNGQLTAHNQLREGHVSGWPCHSKASADFLQSLV